MTLTTTTISIILFRGPHDLVWIGHTSRSSSGSTPRLLEFHGKMTLRRMNSWQNCPFKNVSPNWNWIFSQFQEDSLQIIIFGGEILGMTGTETLDTQVVQDFFQQQDHRKIMKLKYPFPETHHRLGPHLPSMFRLAGLSMNLFLYSSSKSKLRRDTPCQMPTLHPLPICRCFFYSLENSWLEPQIM